ncbi:MAG TPA: hypothetical protein VF487_03620 [Chitinophagaceae bacterium]
MKMRTAFNQLICSTSLSAKKYRGDRKIENGTRNNLIVDAESIHGYSM